MKEQAPEVGTKELRPQARSHNLVTRELPDEELVYDLKNNQAHCLNKLAAAVWKQCDGHQTIAEIASLLEQETGTTVSEQAVNVALYQLNKANLLDPQVGWAPEKPNQLRRDILRRIGLGAAVLPLVTSIIAPTIAQAMSCGDPNNNARQNPVGCSCQSQNDCADECCGFGDICVTTRSVPVGGSCNVNCECTNNCCGRGNTCAAIDSVPVGSTCRVDCECIGSAKCNSSICS